MPRAISRIKTLAPNLVIDVIAANDVRDLMRREADIAVRHVRPEHPDLVARLICEANGYFYASKEYLAARGHPQSSSDLDQHDFISMGDVSRMVDYLTCWVKQPVHPISNNCCRSNECLVWMAPA
ncbi:LysR substrate-binding domain-containing protein [Roseovarius marisflavi]|uniref:LysR substrate-binding domain-containing protein n=1 Tax=Roseovarius marisflavi TaxID=1054996 RepID=UPI003184481C